MRDAAAEFEAMRPHRELLGALGCDVVVVAETTRCIHGDRRARLSQRPVLAPADWPRFAERLDELGVRLQDSGLTLAAITIMGTVVQTEDEVDRLMDSCDDAVALLLDTGHLTFAGGDPARVAARHAARIAHVHCKDVRRAVLDRSLNRDCSFLDAVLDGVFTVPGDGCVDYQAALAPIARAKYRGWLVVEAEQDPSVAPSAQYANLGYRNLPPLRGRAGLAMSSRLGRRGFLGSAIATALLRPFRSFAAAPGYSRLMEGPMVGAVTPDSITFWGRASGEFDVDVEYSTDPSFASPQKSARRCARSLRPITRCASRWAGLRRRRATTTGCGSTESRTAIA